MTFPKPLSALGLFTLLALIAPVHAQKQKQNPPPSRPTAVPSEDEISPDATDTQEKSQKVAAVRAWYIGSDTSPRITLACAPESGDPVALGSYMPSGRFLSYRPIRPGTYTINVLDGSITPSPSTGKISVKERSLAKLPSVNIKADSFTTLLIRETDGKFSLEEIFDKKPKTGTGPSVRIFDFSGDKGLSLWLTHSLTTDKDSQEIWKTPASNPSTLNPLSGGNPFVFILKRMENDAPKRMSSYAASFTSSSAFSLVIYATKPGRIAMRGVQDATADFDPAEIKELSAE